MDTNLISTAIETIGSIISTLLKRKKPTSTTVSVSTDDLFELQSRILQVQSESIKLIEENHNLKDVINEMELKRDKADDIEHHEENFITLKSDRAKIKYCSVCYGKDGKLIPLNDYSTKNGSAECHICKNQIVTNQELYLQYIQRIREQNKRKSYPGIEL